jgi:hypothetical protein
MRPLRLLLVLSCSACTTLAPQSTVPRDIGQALHRLRANVTDLVHPPSGTLAGPDGRPLLHDLRNAIRKLPRTLRLDVPPFADHHASVRLAEAGGDWRPRTMLSRALAKLPW